ncbi:hypothetical protein EBZ35_02935 [bacterium]|nr:hypothetical protein [bacterium]
MKIHPDSQPGKNTDQMNGVQQVLKSCRKAVKQLKTTDITPDTLSVTEPAQPIQTDVDSFLTRAYEQIMAIENHDPAIARQRLITMMAIQFKNANRPSITSNPSKERPSPVDLQQESKSSHYFRGTLDTHEKTIKQQNGLAAIESHTHTLFTLVTSQKSIHVGKQASDRIKINTVEQLASLTPPTESTPVFYDLSPLFATISDQETLQSTIETICETISKNQALKDKPLVATIRYQGKNWAIDLSGTTMRHLRNETGTHHDIFGSFEQWINPTLTPSQNARHFLDLLGIEPSVGSAGIISNPSEDLRTKLNESISRLLTQVKELETSPSIHTQHAIALLKGVMALCNDHVGTLTDPIMTCLCDQLTHLETRCHTVANSTTDIDKIRSLEFFSEEIWATLALLPHQGQTTSLEDTVRQWAGDKGQVITVHPFAMTSLNVILDALRKESKGQEKSVLALASDTYYGVRLSSYDHAFEVVAYQSMADPEAQPKCDILVMDYYPNEVTQPSVQANNIQSVIKHQLSLRDANDRTPFTMVIDTTANTIAKDEINALYREFETDITEGRLVIIPFLSLAKLAQFGLDRSSGGMIQVIGQPEQPFYKTLCDQIQKREKSSPLSDHAQAYFWFLFTYCSQDIEQYVQHVLATTNRAYAALESGLSDEGALALQPRDELIPMIGIHVKWDIEAQQKANLLVLLEHYLMHRCIDTPLNTRVSWGFMHANINDCYTALRITWGLDSEETIHKIVGEISQLSTELTHNQSNPQLSSLINPQNPVSLYEFFESHPDVLRECYDTSPPMDLNTFINKLAGYMAKTRPQP